MTKGSVYIVKKGETLESLACDFGITVVELRQFHNLWCEDIRDQIAYTLREGQKLVVEKTKFTTEERKAKNKAEYQAEQQAKREAQEKQEEVEKRSRRICFL